MVQWLTTTLIINKSVTNPLYSPCVFSKKMTLDSEVKFWPLRTICSPPRTEQWSTSWRSTAGCSWADLWAVKQPKVFMHLILKIWYLTKMYECMVEIMSLKWKVTMRTALNSLWGHLEREPLASGLRNVDTEDHSHSGVFPTHIRLSFLQLNVGISQFQDTSTVNSNIDIV